MPLATPERVLQFHDKDQDCQSEGVMDTVLKGRVILDIRATLRNSLFCTFYL